MKTLDAIPIRPAPSPAANAPALLQEIAAALEDGWGGAVLAAGGGAGDSRRAGMEDRRADAEAGGAGEQDRVTWREGEAEQADQAESHADGQGIGHRPAVGIEADKRLEDRAGGLEDQGDQADLREIEVEAGLQQRVDGRQQHLHRVVQHVADAGADQHGEDCAAGGLAEIDRRAHETVPCMGWVLGRIGGRCTTRRAQ